MRIIIVTPEYREWTGGIIVLHLLGKILKELGENVVFFPKKNPKNFRSPYDIPVVESCTPDDIVVYPESIKANILNASPNQIVNYYLNKSLPKKGYPLFYSKKWADMSGLKAENILFIQDSKHEIFVDQGKKRKGTCYTTRKQKNPVFVHEEGSTFIPRGVKNEELVEIFNTHERFLSYDFSTFLCAQAALCGCESRVVPKKGGSQEMMDRSYPNGKNLGVSYGDTKSNEQLAEERILLRKYFEEDEKNQKERVRIEFDKIKKYMGKI